MLGVPLLLLALPQAAEAAVPTGGPGSEPRPAKAALRSPPPLSVLPDEEVELRVVARAALRGFGDWNYETSIGGHLGGDGDLDLGSLNVNRIGVRFEAWRPIGRRDRLGLEWEFEESGYSFSEATTVRAMDDVYLARLLLDYTHHTSSSLSWTYHAGVEIGAEEGSDVSEGIVIRGGVLSTFAVGRYLDVTAGGYAWTRLEDNPLILPYAEVDWRPTERLHIGWEGSGLGIGYEWKRDIKTWASIGYRERQYRLDDLEIGPQVIEDGVGRDDELALTTGIVLPWYPRLKLELFGGAVLREATLLNESGGQLFQETSDPTYFFGLALLYGEF